VQTEVDVRGAAPVGARRPILVASGVRKVYRTGAETVEALRDIDLIVTAGEFLAVMGPSGSGKTTLLNCLSGLDDIDHGRIEIDGEELTAMSDARRTAHRAKAMGFIFQAFNLIPVFTATENVELPLLLAGSAPRKARAAAQRTLTRVGLGHRLNHRPPELSGGEQQRVTIARALAGRPKIVWADEPTGNLDTETATQVMALLRELHADGLTVILVTHDKEIGATAERRIEVRDGRIVADERLRRTATAPPPPPMDGPPPPPLAPPDQPPEAPSGGLA
jgi:putative ABC transport system ATP-binding protein